MSEINNKKCFTIFCSNKLGCSNKLTHGNIFGCSKCLDYFCSVHRNINDHNCSSLTNENETLVCALYYCKEKLTFLNNFLCKKCNKKYCISHMNDYMHYCY